MIHKPDAPHNDNRGRSLGAFKIPFADHVLPEEEGPTLGEAKGKAAQAADMAVKTFGRSVLAGLTS